MTIDINQIYIINNSNNLQKYNEYIKEPNEDKEPDEQLEEIENENYNNLFNENGFNENKEPNEQFEIIQEKENIIFFDKNNNIKELNNQLNIIEKQKIINKNGNESNSKKNIVNKRNNNFNKQEKFNILHIFIFYFIIFFILKECL